MGRIIKALILGWIGKKIYDRVTDHGEPESEPEKAKPSRSAAHNKPASPSRTTRKTTRRAA